MKLFNFSNLPEKILIEGKFDDTCKIYLSSISADALASGRLKLKIKNENKDVTVSGFKGSFGLSQGNACISIKGSDSEVFFGNNTSGHWFVSLRKKSKVHISDETTSNGTSIYCSNSEFFCGVDCMFSSEVLIQCTDQHGIVDLDTGEILNRERNTVKLGDHVWLGRNSTLVRNSGVGDGSIVATGSIVTSVIPEKCIAAGVPARTIKENRTWTRSLSILDDFSRRYVAEAGSV